MIVEGYNRLGQPFRTRANRVLICDDYGNPLVAAQVHGANAVTVACLEHDGQAFHHMLRQMGVDRTVVVDHFRPLPPG